MLTDWGWLIPGWLIPPEQTHHSAVKADVKAADVVEAGRRAAGTRAARAALTASPHRLSPGLTTTWEKKLILKKMHTYQGLERQLSA